MYVILAGPNVRRKAHLRFASLESGSAEGLAHGTEEDGSACGGLVDFTCC
jgi:hypothetical protein